MPFEEENKSPINRHSLHSLRPEFDRCETSRMPNNNFRLEIPSAADDAFQKPL